MEIEEHNIGQIKIAEVISDELVIRRIEDGVDLLGNLYYSGFESIILHKNTITPDFFDLKTGIAGEILQKFATYRVRLAIVGDFSEITSQSFRDFMYESNNGIHIHFLATVDEALERFK